MLRKDDFVNKTIFADICIDFDGVLHSYKSGWQGVDIIPDPPVAGAIRTLYDYLESGLSLAIYSARSSQGDGIIAMQEWLGKHDRAYRYKKRISPRVPMLVARIAFPESKPAAKVYIDDAKVYIDDRGYRFEGVFPTPDELKKLYKTWNQQDV